MPGVVRVSVWCYNHLNWRESETLLQNSATQVRNKLALQSCLIHVHVYILRTLYINITEHVEMWFMYACITLFCYCYFTYLKLSHIHVHMNIRYAVCPNHFRYERMHCSKTHSNSSLVPRPLPVFQCCTLKNGRAWEAINVIQAG